MNWQDRPDSDPTASKDLCPEAALVGYYFLMDSAHVNVA